MKKIVWLAIAVFSVSLFVGQLSAADAKLDRETRERLDSLNAAVDELKSGAQDASPQQRSWRGESVNQAFVALTGEAINPLFGVTVLGMYNYFRTPEHLREALPIYDRPEVWVPLLIIILLMLFNSTICEALPFLKVPLNAIGDIVNKAGAVAVLPLVIKMFADTVAQPAAEQIEAFAGIAFPVAYAGQAGTMDTVWLSLGWLSGAAIGFVVYAAVWLTFNVVDVLILICPFPGVDALLKGFRLSVIGVLVGTSQVSGTVATILAAVIVLISLVCAGWSFRLSVFGLLYSTDILFFRRRDIGSEDGATAFAGAGLQQSRKIPMRTLGRLRRNGNGELVFSYRPWLVMPRREIVLGRSELFAGGRGLLNPFLVACGNPSMPWLRLPPRYRGQEKAMSEQFALPSLVDCGVSGALRTWLSENFGGGGKEAKAM